MIEGSGSQTGSNRWGDYSMMGIDPLDDCTFWYTQMYVATTGSNTWRTRIGAFRFPGCSIGPQGALQGKITSSLTSAPIDGATIQATQSSTQTLVTSSNSAGDYLIVAPAGSYTVTASAYGYYPLVESGVEILSGTTTLRNYALEIAPSHVISGVVRDAANGWPLYAKISLSGIDAGPIWSDPLSGFYSLEIPDGSSLDFTVEAFLEGYQPGEASVSNITGDMSVNFDLPVDPSLCSTPGYQPQVSPLFSSDFENGSGGLSVSGTSSWAWGAVTSGPGSAHSGVNAWATNLDGHYSNYENGYLSLPAIDLSAFSGQTPALRWSQWLQTEACYDFASIEASKDGGGSWQVVNGPLSGAIDSSWQEHYLTLDPAYAVANLRICFRFTSDATVTYPGWYIDDLTVGMGECVPIPGGLVSGNVLEGNTLTGLNGAVVSSDSGVSTTSLPTPQDPNLEDGFYTLFFPTGTYTLTAAYLAGYNPDVRQVEIEQFGSVGQDFILQAGMLGVEPGKISANLQMGDTVTRTLTITNQGGASANVELVELLGSHLPIGPFEEPDFATKPFKADLPSAKGLGAPAAAGGEPLQAGDVIQSWVPGNAALVWAAAYDPQHSTVWASSPSQLWGGVDEIFEFEPDGEPTGRSYTHPMAHVSGPADLAFNLNTGNLWIMNVNTGYDNCIHEIDPNQGYTGEKICPGGASGFAISQRGLAYDPFSDTFFAGGWNNLMIYHFDRDGNILSSVNSGLAISGLAYNPETKHLFALTSESDTRVFVLDAAQEYAVLGQFKVSKGFGTYSGGGLEIDCQGSLWAVDINENRVVQLESGEPGGFCQTDIPWIASQPVSATLAAHTTLPFTITLDASVPEVDQPGLYSMIYRVNEDTPFAVANIPVSMTVSAPASWGKLAGNIQSLGYCDADAYPLANADVTISSSNGLSWTMTTDAQGHYQRWVDELGSPFTVTASAPEHSAAIANGVVVAGGITSTLDLDLVWLRSCTAVSPEGIDEAVKFGRQLTTDLQVSNYGHLETPYYWREYPGSGGQAADLDWLSVEPVSGTIPIGPGFVGAAVRLDAGAPSITQTGVYSAWLVLENEDPIKGGIPIVVKMTVLPLEYGVELTSPITAANGIPGEALSYTLSITNSSEGLTDTIHLSLEGGAGSSHSHILRAAGIGRRAEHSACGGHPRNRHARRPGPPDGYSQLARRPGEIGRNHHHHNRRGAVCRPGFGAERSS